MKNSNVKKGLMYLSGEDFYLFCYAVIITLDSLKCNDGKYFKDYRKLAFIIDFIKDERLIYILNNLDSESHNNIDKEYLFNSYSNGLTRRSEDLKLLFTLEKKGFISLEKGNISSLVNVSLNKKNLPKSFFDKTIFGNEYDNLNSLKTSVKRLSTLTLDTMLGKIYRERGIKTWAI
jgi:hypothetical protein